MENSNEKQQESQKLPQDVNNKAQDPDSMRDPLKQQLERSEGKNGPEEQKTLDKLRDQYHESGDTPAK
jgi:hypothetical protein